MPQADIHLVRSLLVTVLFAHLLTSSSGTARRLSQAVQLQSQQTRSVGNLPVKPDK